MVFNPISKIQKEPVTPVKYECHAGSPPAPAGIPPVGIQILPKRQASQRYGRPRCVHSSRWPSPAVDPDSPSPPTHQHVQASKRHEGSATGSIHSTPSSQSPPPPPNLKPPRRTRREGVRRWSRFETAVWATAPPPSTPSSLAAPRGGCTHLGARSGAGRVGCGSGFGRRRCSLVATATPGPWARWGEIPSRSLSVYFSLGRMKDDLGLVPLARKRGGREAVVNSSDGLLIGAAAGRWVGWRDRGFEGSQGRSCKYDDSLKF